jgi:hypothetical protein
MESSVHGRVSTQVYSVRLFIRGLTGIHVQPKQQQQQHHRSLRAVIAVTRDGITYGTSIFSDPLMPDEKSDTFIAVWDNKRRFRQGIEFEASLPDPAHISTPNASARWSPHRNYNLIVGVVETDNTIVPIAAASLPIAAATQLKGQKNEILLDLPIFNVASLDCNPFASQDRPYPLHRGNTDARLPHLAKQNADPVQNYSVGENIATLRVQIHLHEKKNVMMKEDDAATTMANSLTSAVHKQNQHVVLVRPHECAIETAHHAPPAQDDDSVLNSILSMEPSIERVMSGDTEDDEVVVVDKNGCTTPRRTNPKLLRVKIVDQTTMDFELRPVKRKMKTPTTPSSTSSGSTTNSPNRDKLMLEAEDILQVLESSIERVLSDEENEKSGKSKTTQRNGVWRSRASSSSILSNAKEKADKRSSKTNESPTRKQPLECTVDPQIMIKPIEPFVKDHAFSPKPPRKPFFRSRSASRPSNTTGGTNGSIGTTEPTSSVSAQDLSSVASKNSRRPYHRKGSISNSSKSVSATSVTEGSAKVATATNKPQASKFGSFMHRRNDPSVSKETKVIQTKRNNMEDRGSFSVEIQSEAGERQHLTVHSIVSKTPMPSLLNLPRKEPKLRMLSLVSKKARKPAPSTPPKPRNNPKQDQLSTSTPAKKPTSSPKSILKPPKIARSISIDGERSLAQSMGGFSPKQMKNAESSPGVQGIESLSASDSITNASKIFETNLHQTESLPNGVSSLPSLQNKGTSTDVDVSSPLTASVDKEAKRSDSSSPRDTSKIEKELPKRSLSPVVEQMIMNAQNMKNSNSMNDSSSILSERTAQSTELQQSKSVTDVSLPSACSHTGHARRFSNCNEDTKIGNSSLWTEKYSNGNNEADHNYFDERFFYNMRCGDLLKAHSFVKDRTTSEILEPHQRKLLGVFPGACASQIDKMLQRDDEDDGTWDADSVTRDGSTFFTDKDRYLPVEERFRNFLMGGLCRPNMDIYDDDFFEYDEELTQASGPNNQDWLNSVRDTIMKRFQGVVHEADSVEDNDFSVTVGTNGSMYTAESGEETEEATKKSLEDSLEEESSNTDQGTEVDISQVNKAIPKASPAFTTGTSNTTETETSTIDDTEKDGSIAVASGQFDALQKEQSAQDSQDVRSVVLGASARYDDSYIKLLPMADKYCSKGQSFQEMPRPYDEINVKDDGSPKSVLQIHSMPDASKPKSFAQSFVDLLLDAISPSPNEPNITLVPSTLEANEISSVGELTATTHELQVDIEEYKKRIGRLETKDPSIGIPSIVEELEDDYFAEYQGVPVHGIVATDDPEAAKQLSSDKNVGHFC